MFVWHGIDGSKFGMGIYGYMSAVWQWMQVLIRFFLENIKKTQKYLINKLLLQ